mmetsp:Transcript_29406/g.68895  ORF Transcript_29406/g.68895 Transcript_29406/m.68895 type:complete len:235 (-) Transcript_29406:64-768(-)
MVPVVIGRVRIVPLHRVGGEVVQGINVDVVLGGNAVVLQDRREARDEGIALVRQDVELPGLELLDRGGCFGRSVRRDAISAHPLALRKGPGRYFNAFAGLNVIRIPVGFARLVVGCRCGAFGRISVFGVVIAFAARAVAEHHHASVAPFRRPCSRHAAALLLAAFGQVVSVVIICFRRRSVLLLIIPAVVIHVVVAAVLSEEIVETFVPFGDSSKFSVVEVPVLLSPRHIFVGL